MEAGNPDSHFCGQRLDSWSHCPPHPLLNFLTLIPPDIFFLPFLIHIFNQQSLQCLLYSRYHSKSFRESDSFSHSNPGQVTNDATTQRTHKEGKWLTQSPSLVPFFPTRSSVSLCTIVFLLSSKDQTYHISPILKVTFDSLNSRLTCSPAETTQGKLFIIPHNTF